MDIWNLPAEMIEEIAKYLNFQDIVSCSKTCTKWEVAFNIDKVWVRFVTIDKKWLNKNLSKVNYDGEKSKGNHLQSCDSKELAMREEFVKRNVVSGNFHKEVIHIGAAYCDCIKEAVDEAGNHWLFVSLTDGLKFESNHTIQVWNLNRQAELHSSTITPGGESKRPFGSHIEVFADKLFYVQTEFVLVYEFVEPQFELKFISRVEVPMKGAQQVSTHMICLPNIIVGFVNSNYTQEGVPPSYNVWSLDGAVICNNYDQFQPEENGVLRLLKPVIRIKKNDLNNVVVIYSYCFRIDADIQFKFVVKLFNTKTLKYNEMSIEKQGIIVEVAVSKKVIVLIYTIGKNCFKEGLIVEIYHVNDGSHLFSTQIVSTTEMIPYQFVNTGDVFASVNRKGFSIYRLDVGEMNVDFKHVINVEFSRKVKMVALLKNACVLLEHPKNVYELFNYRTASKIFQLKLTNHELKFDFNTKCYLPPNIIAYTNPAVFYARPIDENFISVISFW